MQLCASQEKGVSHQHSGWPGELEKERGTARKGTFRPLSSIIYNKDVRNYVRATLLIKAEQKASWGGKSCLREGFMANLREEKARVKRPESERW